MEKNINKAEEIEINEEAKVEELTEETLDNVDGGIVGIVAGYWAVCFLAGVASGYCK